VPQFSLAVLPIATLLLGMVIQALLARVLSSSGKGWLAFGTSMLAMAGVAATWPTVLRGEAIDLVLGSWDGPITLAYHVDGLSLLFALMGTGIGSAVLLFSVGYMSKDESATRFYIVMQLFIAGLVNLVYSANLLLMYASWEIVGICSFLLVGFWYRQREAAAGARKVLVITHAAGYALLAAILILFARTGTLTWTDPRIGPAFTTGVFVLMFIAAMAKSVQFPLHTWIPSAMAAPSPVSALLHSACYVTAGVYLVARMHSFAVWPVAWQTGVVWVGTVTMLVGILFAMIQSDSKKMLAFSTVSQIGYMMLGLGLSTSLGIIAGLLHLLNHGLFKGGLFLGAGAIQHATGTRDMNKLGGLGHLMPSTTALWVISAASIAGVPLFNGFVSKWLIYVAALSAGYVIPALIAWIVSIMTMFTLLKATSAMFFGDEGEASAGAHESPRSMLFGSGALAVGCIVLGVAPQLGVIYAVAPSLKGMALASDTLLSWADLTSATSSLYTLAGLVLSILSLVVGGVIYVLATRRRRGALPARKIVARPTMVSATGPAGLALAAVGIQHVEPLTTFTGGEPLCAEGRMRANDFSALLVTGLAPVYAWVDPDRYLLAIWHGTLAACGAAGRAGEWLERHALAAVAAFAAAIGIVAATTSGVTRTAAEAGGAATPWPLFAAVAIALLALLLVQASVAELRRHAWLAAVSGALVLGGVAAQEPFLRLALLEAAAFGAVVLLVLNGVDRVARNAYLAAAVLSALALASATILLPSGPAGLVLALFLVGFAVKLALVPTYLWLPTMALRTPAALVGLIVAVIDVAAFGELIMLRHEAAWLFEPTWPWLSLALLSALGGAGLMLAQHSLKRMLALSTVVGAGFIVAGVSLAGPYGLAGAALAAAADALAMGLLFTSISAVESDGDVTLASRELARRHPLASAGFLLGAFTALGIPFTAGWPGHWRIYAAANGAGWPALAVLIVATILSVLAYARVVALVWWGENETEPAEKNPPHPWKTIWTSEGAAMGVAIVLLLLACVAAGLVPGIL
jgi:NADH:ubiquinone oxidoreductase subunit 5 (subunit L)/multisubunit Na+/H+ antiporter MnhA subunit